ncbi:response regulator [Niastella caeni]|uniref:Response regulator n=1 Tax=Niastella caeni TaxID=2569763 RepID=A0A4S8HRM0_9BACT|nr:response regulator [Niastella caeni]THU38158.1 response regulator [Niastella caeni]
MHPVNKILLVDDDEATNFLSRILLQKIHAAKEIMVAEDGRMALDLIQQTGCPDIIFLDIRMPQMDGFEFLDSLESTNKWKNAKIIMLSSVVQAEDKERARAYSSVMDCLEKPITQEMVEKVTKEYWRDKAHD